MADEEVYGYRGKAVIKTDEKGVRKLSAVIGTTAEVPGIDQPVDDEALKTWIRKDKLSEDLVKYQLVTEDKAVRKGLIAAAIVSVAMFVSAMAGLVIILNRF